MSTRAGRTLASLALRSLRPQFYSNHGRQLPSVVPVNVAAVSSTMASSSFSSWSPGEGKIYQGRRELWNVEARLVDPAPLTGESADKSSMKESSGIDSWNLERSQEILTCYEWSSGVDCRFSQELQRWNRELIAAGHEAVTLRRKNFFSRYLQWSSFDRSVRVVESQKHLKLAAGSPVDMDALVAVAGQHSKSTSSSLQLSSSFSSSLDFLEEPSKIIALDASSVKRKRKKKMNKHKQRKLRRRDRHRN